MNIQETLFKFIEGNEAGFFELQKLLCSHKALAPNAGGTGEYKKGEALIAWLKAHGISEFERFDAPDERVPEKLRPNIVVTIKGKSERRVWIMSHLDVVPEGHRNMWLSDPYEAVLRDGMVFGRGVEDNQQGMVSSIFAALAFLKNNIVPEYTLKLLFVADEEVGSVYGIQYLLKAHAIFKNDDLILVPDGGCSDGSEIEVAEKGIMQLKITTTGQQGHAAMPDQANNAFIAASALVVKISALEQSEFPKRDPLFSPDRSTINPTKKEANVPNINTIPGSDVFFVDMRMLPLYDLDAAYSAVERLCKLIESEYRVTVKIDVMNRHSSRPTPANAPVVKLLGDAVRAVYKVEPRVVGIGGGTVAAYLRNAGYDCVVWARMDERAHQPNEYSKMENMVGDAKVFAALLAGGN